MAKQRFHYGWVVAVCCSLLALSVNAMGNNSQFFYVAPLAEAFGVTRVALNFSLFTMGTIMRTLTGFVYGRLVRRFDVKPLMVAGVLLTVCAYLVFSFASGLFMIALGSTLYGLAHAIGTFSAYNIIVSNWFVRRRGVVLGLVNTSVGLGGMIINPLVSAWIVNAGWSTSYLYTAGLIAAIALPAVFMVKVTPEDKGLTAYGSESVVNQAAAAGTQSQPIKLLQLGDAMRTLRFWLIAGIQFILGLAVGQSFGNIIPHLNALQVDAALTSVLSVVLAFGATLGNLLSGFVYDRFGLRALIFSIGAIMGVGMIFSCFISANSPVVWLVLAVFCVGYGNSISLGTLLHLINGAFGAGNTNVGALFGWLFAVGSAGNIIGSPLSGRLYDITGSYASTYVLSLITLALVLVMTQIVVIQGKKALMQQAAER